VNQGRACQKARDTHAIDWTPNVRAGFAAVSDAGRLRQRRIALLKDRLPYEPQLIGMSPLALARIDFTA
jgi:hypothetical protein